MGFPHDLPRAPAFALTVPGLGSLLVDEARRLGLRPGRVEVDGRADVVPVATPAGTVTRLRTAEEVFVEIGRLQVRRSAATTATLDRAVVEALHRIGGRRAAFRVVVRLRDERSFRRTDLRDALGRAIIRTLPHWRVSEAGAVEVWALQTSRDGLRLGVRIPSVADRRRVPRPVERHGALRPAVAAAMVRLAGAPGDVLVDPCCGTGTILAEARDIGWRTTIGGDIDVAALDAARRDVHRVVLVHADGRRLPVADGSADAVVTNLPFGRQHQVQGAPVAWYRRVLSECLRVAPTAVVLAPPSPPFRQALGRTKADLVARHDIVLLGRPTTIWKVVRPTAVPRRV